MLLALGDQRVLHRDQHPAVEQRQRDRHRLAADDRLNPGGRQLHGKFHGAKEVVAIGNRAGRQFMLLAKLDQILDFNGSLKERISGMNAQRDIEGSHLAKLITNRL